MPIGTGILICRIVRKFGGKASFIKTEVSGALPFTRDYNFVILGTTPQLEAFRIKFCVHYLYVDEGFGAPIFKKLFVLPKIFLRFKIFKSKGKKEDKTAEKDAQEPEKERKLPILLNYLRS